MRIKDAWDWKENVQKVYSMYIYIYIFSLAMPLCGETWKGLVTLLQKALHCAEHLAHQSDYSIHVFLSPTMWSHILRWLNTVRKMRETACWHAVAVRLGYKKLKEEYSKWFMEGSGDTATKNVALWRNLCISRLGRFWNSFWKKMKPERKPLSFPQEPQTRIVCLEVTWQSCNNHMQHYDIIGI